jgi:hypothetical protein
MEKENSSENTIFRLLDQVREKIRLKHYSIRTEQAGAIRPLAPSF